MSVSAAASAGGGGSASTSPAVAASRAYCREVAQREARNFYYGMKLVPEPQRSDMFALYAWMRAVDDIADADGPLDEKRRRLDAFRRDSLRMFDADADPYNDLPADQLWPGFHAMVRAAGIEWRWLDEMIAGQLLDQEKTRYRTFAELEDYCYQVASTVGLCCIAIWGCDGGEEAQRLAIQRGKAFQLTNILRDVREDAGRDRVYVPAEAFDAFEINPSMFTLGKPAELVPALRRVVDRAKLHYENSAPLDKMVHPAGRACLWAMTSIYRGILEKIARDPAVVLGERRVRLGKPRKSWIALRASLMKGRG